MASTQKRSDSAVDQAAKEIVSTSDNINPRCSICDKIVEILHTGVESPDASYELGTWAQLVDSTGCAAHRNLFIECFQRTRATSLEKFTIHHYQGYCYKKIVYRKTPGNHNSIALELLKSTSGPRFCVRQKAVNPFWIDMEQIQGWRNTCRQNHTPECSEPLTAKNLTATSPVRFVDTTRQCLVPASPDLQYVALSYVWGETNTFKTLRSNVQQLQRQDALQSPQCLSRLPRTIHDAIKLAEALKERYVWIDSLCIVQDDECERDTQISNMGSIFDNAAFTIIAAEGEDADFGLPGLEGISRPRQHDLETFTFQKDDRDILELYIRRRSKTKWARRGWTFQEDAFSKRRLKFDKYGVRWECSTTVCEEHRESDDFLVRKGRGWSERFHFLRAYPSIPDFAFLVWSYNRRELTYGEDGLRAFEGIITALSHKFQGGFIHGLPVMFLDIALLWQMNGACERRVGSQLNAESRCPPSWSWAGWKGEIRYMLWGAKCDCLRQESMLERTVPMVEWFSQESKESNPVSITHQNSWCRDRAKYLGGANDLPPGWTKHDINSADQKAMRISPQTHYYQHSSIPETQFWYPIPLPAPHHDPVIQSWVDYYRATPRAPPYESAGM
ncbi:HET-domain-containing protein [Lophium mytilinum]|uniref:HET-domain-containing protein n=1 Tax=Lophium mytilinum TaxID=390894 RepID=A0A6A6QLM0_9PEZI|nr:HET-domain-containing protein [Lophium mytilinum]